MQDQHAGIPAYYQAPIASFLVESDDAILGKLTTGGPFSVEATQRDAWIAEVAMLKGALSGFDGHVFLEFDVPRIGSRIDAVIVVGPAIFVLEFKVGEDRINTHDFNQAWDYALDLKNFHLASHDAPIFPVLIPTETTITTGPDFSAAPDRVYKPVVSTPDGLGSTIRGGLVQTTGPNIDPVEWGRAPYHPTPTIIEAAQALYSRHSVSNITRREASAKNLASTSERIDWVVEQARQHGTKAIVFVTGVPGAGKTLVGLNIATKQRGESPTHAVFLSGNGPLVKVLSEALARDEMTRLKKKKDKTRKGVVEQKIKAFIQNVHHFRDAGLNDRAAPSDRVVIFDEAQRAWNREMTADFMKRKKGKPGFSQSEPEFLLSYLDRHQGWAVVICLVGGGQEINRGEAGISAWLDAVANAYSHWTTYISPNLTGAEYAAGIALERIGKVASVQTDPDLHLAVSMRSFRAEHVSGFVKAMLDREAVEASAVLKQVSSRYPIVITRDLKTAKSWLRSHARGSERYGLVASSSAQRLKAHAVDIRVKVDPVHWFLNGREDTRSSFYLEDAATEFQVQGLELDWACVAWDADLRFVSPNWSFHSFSGTRWKAVKQPERQSYLRNAYRVLLTRARQGMVIFIPPGQESDRTRLPQFYDSTFEFLSGVGIPVI